MRAEISHRSRRARDCLQLSAHWYDKMATNRNVRHLLFFIICCSIIAGILPPVVAGKKKLGLCLYWAPGNTVPSTTLTACQGRVAQTAALASKTTGRSADASAILRRQCSSTKMIPECFTLLVFSRWFVLSSCRSSLVGRVLFRAVLRGIGVEHVMSKKGLLLLQSQKSCS